MVNLKPLLVVLKIITLIGLVSTVGMMTAVVHKSLKEKYPKQVEKYEWAFFVLGGLMTLVMFFLYQKFVAPA